VEDADAYTYDRELYNEEQAIAVLDEIIPYAKALADPEFSDDEMREVLRLPAALESSDDDNPTTETNPVTTDLTNAAEVIDSGYASANDEANSRTESPVSRSESASQNSFTSGAYLFPQCLSVWRYALALKYSHLVSLEKLSQLDAFSLEDLASPEVKITRKLRQGDRKRLGAWLRLSG
jgi:hypothetical protein